MEIMLGNVPIVAAKSAPSRITAIVWGPSGVGKTTLACTAPGRKLVVCFDPDGTTSVRGFPQVDVADFSATTTGIVEQFKKDNDPLGLSKVLEHYDTIIIDSLTTIGEKALAKGVMDVKGASLERPSPGAYQTRNNLVLALVKNVLALTGRHNKHCFFLAHEDAPVTNDEGTVLFTTMSLGGKLPNQVPLNLSEVWHMRDSGKTKKITIRSTAILKPMKTRMFVTTGEGDFDWKFNPEDYNDPKNVGHRIEDWYTTWTKNDGKKIPLPK